MSKTLRIILAVSCLGLVASIGYTAKLAWDKTQASLEAWEQGRCWDRVGNELNGKEFELDTKKREVKPLSSMTQEDLLRALYVYHWKHYQISLRLNQINDLSSPVELGE